MEEERSSIPELPTQNSAQHDEIQLGTGADTAYVEPRIQSTDGTLRHSGDNVGHDQQPERPSQPSVLTSSPNIKTLHRTTSAPSNLETAKKQILLSRETPDELTDRLVKPATEGKSMTSLPYNRDSQGRGPTILESVDDNETSDGFENLIHSPPGQNAIVEQSPGGRYVRFLEKLGSGASKDVYRAYDTTEGIEVAWNVVQLSGVPKSERNRIVNEVRLLERLHHPNIISFHGSWVNRERQEVNFVTEILSSGTLTSFIEKVQVIRWKIAKRWAFQILKGLEYLHAQDPPVIHRDLKCQNIFINGTSGDLRIGDLGLSTVHRNGKVLSVLGTPEFMAPDLYEESAYDEKVDIYAFGMCLLEILTKEIPYRECSNPAQIYKKVTRREKPESLKRLRSKMARDFINLCLGYQDEATGKYIRPSATELLQHNFLAKSADDDSEVIVDPPLHRGTILEDPVPRSGTDENSNGILKVKVPLPTSRIEEEDFAEDGSDHFEEMPDSEVNIRRVKVFTGRNEELKEEEEGQIPLGQSIVNGVKSIAPQQHQHSGQQHQVGSGHMVETNMLSASQSLPASVSHQQEPAPMPQGQVTQTTTQQSQVLPPHVHAQQAGLGQGVQPQMTHQGLERQQQLPQGLQLQASTHQIPQQAISQLAPQQAFPHAQITVQGQQVPQQQSQQQQLSHQGQQQFPHHGQQQVPHHGQQQVPHQGQQQVPHQGQQQVPQHAQQQITQQGQQQVPQQGQQQISQQGQQQIPQQGQQQISQQGQQQIPQQGFLFDAAVIEDESAAMVHYLDDILNLIIRLPVDGQTQNVQFKFHLVEDDPVEVAREMVTELGIPQEATLEISATISALARHARMEQDKHRRQAVPAGLEGQVAPQHGQIVQNAPHNLAQAVSDAPQTQAFAQVQSLAQPAVNPAPLVSQTASSIAEVADHAYQTPSQTPNQTPAVSPLSHLIPRKGGLSLTSEASGLSTQDPIPIAGDLHAARRFDGVEANPAATCDDEDFADEDEDSMSEELKRLDEDFQRNMLRAQKVFDSRMDNLQRSKLEKEMQHKKTLQRHEKERIEFEKRVQQEAKEQSKRLEKIQREWEAQRELLERAKKKANSQTGEQTSGMRSLATSPSQEFMDKLLPLNQQPVVSVPNPDYQHQRSSSNDSKGN